MPEFAVTKADVGERLDRFLAARMPHLSRSRIQALIKTKCVHIARVNASSDGIDASQRVKNGDVIFVEEPEAKPAQIEAEKIALDVLFEDEDLIVINKPAGIVVHPAAGNAEHTIVNALLNHCKSLSGIGGELRPGIVHRLDKETSGCLVAAKNDFAHRELSRQFSSRSVTKIYLALAAGRLQHKRGAIETMIGRHPVQRKKMAVIEHGRGGRIAKTEWRVLAEFSFGSLVECTLHTGRTHQIRVHLKHIGHPVLGDKIYAPKLAESAKFPRQMLHAWKLGFAHPRTRESLLFCSPLPQDFLNFGVPPI